MKKFTYLILFSLSICFSCDIFDGPANTCIVSDPLADLPWLNTIQQSYESAEMSEYNYIGQGTYNDETVFYLASCCPLCNWALKIYDCSGDRVEGNYTLEDLEDKKVIWKSADSECFK